MLQDIREKSLGTFGKVIVGIIIAVFALFGVESIIGGFTQPPAVASVNGEDITQFQLDQNIQNLMASIGGNLDGIDPSFLESIALNQLIEEALLRQKTLSDSMSISSDQIDIIQKEVTNIISYDCVTQIAGVFICGTSPSNIANVESQHSYELGPMVVAPSSDGVFGTAAVGAIGDATVFIVLDVVD